MNSKVFKSALGSQHKYDVKAETMFDAPFYDIICSIPEEYLEEAVAKNFDAILQSRRVAEFKYFKLFPSWKKLFFKNLPYILDHMLMCKQNYLRFLEMFNEYAPEVYTKLLELYTQTGYAYSFDIVDEILVPMVDLERWQYWHFPILRDNKKMALLLKNTLAHSGYGVFWKLLYYLEDELDFDRQEIGPFLQEKAEEFADSYTSEAFDGTISNFDYHDKDDLEDFFRDKEAYQYFLEKLPRLLRAGGLELYTLLVNVLGPYRDITTLYHECAEFHLEEEKERQIANEFLARWDTELLPDNLISR